METRCRLLVYLDKKSILVNIKEKSEQFLKEITKDANQKFSPLRYLLNIDVMDLYDTFPDLGDLLLKEPLKWQKNMNQILLACLLTLNVDSIPINSAQVTSNIRLRNLPQLLVNPNQHNYGGLTCFLGILIQVSKTTSYVNHTVWSCPEQCEDCEIILHYLPKVSPRCHVCKSVLYENSPWRSCGDQVTATFKLDNGILCKNFIILDDLIAKLCPGSQFAITAVVLKNVIGVWNIEEINILSAPLTYPEPSDIQQLFKACNGLPWTFICCLASSIGNNVCPFNCFMHLKIYLLLSLTSIKANSLSGSNIIHVLAAGYDTGYAGKLMTEAAKLADRSLALGHSTTVSTALISNSGGVCHMPLPLFTYNQKQTASILCSIESGEISTDICRVKLRTAVWAQGMDFKKNILFNVASVFGTLCRGDFGEFNDEIAEHLLQNAKEPQKVSGEVKQALKDIAEYIDLVAGINVSLSDFTETLLKSYFLAARKERTGGVSVGSMAALVTTCVTSARLCRRPITNVEDAVLAIWLHACGCPEPRSVPEEYLQTPADIKKFRKVIDNFKCWLEEFTGCLISNIY